MYCCLFFPQVPWSAWFHTQVRDFGLLFVWRPEKDENHIAYLQHLSTSKPQPWFLQQRKLGREKGCNILMVWSINRQWCPCSSPSTLEIALTALPTGKTVCQANGLPWPHCIYASFLLDDLWRWNYCLRFPHEALQNIHTGQWSAALDTDKRVEYNRHQQKGTH